LSNCRGEAGSRGAERGIKQLRRNDAIGSLSLGVRLLDHRCSFERFWDSTPLRWVTMANWHVRLDEGPRW